MQTGGADSPVSGHSRFSPPSVRWLAGCAELASAVRAGTGIAVITRMWRMAWILAAGVASAGVTELAQAQGPQTIEIAPGDSVSIVHQRVFDRGPAVRVPGKRLDVQYTTSIPASDAAGRLAQADRAAAYFGPQAAKAGARRLSIGICDTTACIERRHPPSEWHLYERRHEGWRRVDPDRIR
jgi:hypothetical protein